MRDFWKDPYIESAAYYSVVVLSIVVFLVVFELVTKYKNWEEIQKGNMAVAMATGGKIFGLANIFRYSIEHNDNSVKNARMGNIWVRSFTSQLFYFRIFDAKISNR